MTYRDIPIGMWVPYKGSYLLNPHNKGLKKWLPILTEKKSFAFRDDIEVQWAHEWPQKLHKGHKVIFFIRDPRDALLSACKRDSPLMTLKEYVINGLRLELVIRLYRMFRTMEQFGLRAANVEDVGGGWLVFHGRPYIDQHGSGRFVLRINTGDDGVVGTLVRGDAVGVIGVEREEMPSVL